MFGEYRMKPTRQDILDAAYSGNAALLREFARRGGDFNEIADGDTLLHDAVSDLCVDDKPYRYDIVHLLLTLGADPKILGDEHSSALVPAMLEMDTEMLRILLDAGVDPNRTSGFTESELLYDWAEFDYRYQVYDINPPDKPSEDDKRDEESWLRFLDRIAIKNNVRRPDHLILLREHGARSAHEMKRNT